jgi:general secretion pathway protein J
MRYPVATCAHPRGEAGFTLIELLVALSILGLLTGLGAALLHLGARSWERTARLSADLDTVEAMQRSLRLELARAKPVAAEGSDAAFFEAGPQSVSFTAELPEALQGIGAVPLRLAVSSPDEDTKRLVLQWYDRRKSVWAYSVLLPSIRDARFAYFGADDPSAAPSWRSSWNAKTLPELIRIDIDFPQDDGRIWPSLIVAPMISTDLTCLHNAAGTC